MYAMIKLWALDSPFSFSDDGGGNQPDSWKGVIYVSPEGKKERGIYMDVVCRVFTHHVWCSLCGEQRARVGPRLL